MQVTLSPVLNQPVIIENQAIRIEVWPHLGGKVSSLLDKADQFELLFNYPVEYPIQASHYDLPFIKGWCAGWDECFPAIAPSRYVGHPYDGIPVPDHGEIWSLPTTAVPTKNGITTVWHGLRFGYRLTRKLFLEESSVIAEYTLVNLAPFEFRFVWAMHPLFSMASPIEIDLPGTPRFKWSHDAAMHDFQQEFVWPMTEEGDNLAKVDGLAANRGWKVFSCLPITSPLTLRYPNRGRSVTIDYRSEDALTAHWGIWINSGGWEGQRNLSIEPVTARFDQIDRAIKDGIVGTVAAMGRRVWSVKLTLT